MAIASKSTLGPRRPNQYTVLSVSYGTIPKGDEAERVSTSPAAFATEAVDEVHEGVLVIGASFVSGADDMTGGESQRIEFLREWCYIPIEICRNRSREEEGGGGQPELILRRSKVKWRDSINHEGDCGSRQMRKLWIREKKPVLRF